MQRPHVRSRSKPRPETMDLTKPPSSSSSIAKPKSKPTKTIILITVASVVIALGIFLVCYLVLISGRNNRRSLFRYSVVIDGGSSGTRVHVFRYRIESDKPVFDFGEKSYDSMKLSPGLSAYADDPEGVRVSVEELVGFAKKRVSKGKLEEIEIRLMATAGMRLLDLSVQEQILEVSRRVLSSSGFRFREEWASVISG